MLVTGVGSASAARASRDDGLLLTIAARSCPSFTDITANLARNNIMESLRDLGADTAYQPGQPIDPEIEERAQPNCVPLPDWRFTLGDSYRTKAVTGAWGSLSIVNNAFDTDVTTEKKVELLDPQGAPTGREIEGATTLRLTPEQAALAARRSLWIQGGTPTDPILNQEFPGPQYGFGALRCAVDNLNGDNVEFIAYPAGITHVFCFAYYVLPPPTSGTIVVRKEVRAPTETNETFSFDGNVSYNPGGVFTLPVRGGKPASETFFRGATGDHKPWTVRELDTPDWKLTGLACTSRDRTSSIDSSLADATASINLGAGDLVTCTYTNEYAPPPHGLEIRKVTEGGVGRFSYTVDPAAGGPLTQATATTTEEGIAVDADPSPLDLAAGRYGITEHLPSSDRGRWELKAVECDGQSEPVKQPIEVTVETRAVRSCTFTNDFIPRGAVEISKITKGAVGTSGFLVTPLAGDPTPYQQSATTTREGEAVRARGADTGNLELGRYLITDLPPAPGIGEWALTYVACNGKAVPASEGRIEVALTAANPELHCTFTNTFASSPPPLPEQPQPPSPEAQLVLTKSATSPTVTVGNIVTYRLEVTNRGSGPASDVTVIDQPQSEATFVSAEPGRGSCGNELPLVCTLGTVKPGESVVVKVRMRPQSPGRFTNHAVIGTTTGEARIAAGEANATVHVKAAHSSSPPPAGLG